MNNNYAIVEWNVLYLKQNNKPIFSTPALYLWLRTLRQLVLFCSVLFCVNVSAAVNRNDSAFELPLYFLWILIG